MRFQSAALLAALVIVLACAERLKIPNERPDINSTLEGNIISGGGGGGGNDGVGGDIVIAFRQSLCEQPSKKVQRSSEAMLATIASFALTGAAVLTIVSGGGGGGNEGGGGGRPRLCQYNNLT